MTIYGKQIQQLDLFFLKLIQFKFQLYEFLTDEFTMLRLQSKSLILVLIAFFFGNLLSLFFLFHFSIKLQNDSILLSDQLHKMELEETRIIYYDEALTMSARMAAATGDLTWQDRYNSYIPKLDYSLDYLMNSVEIAESVKMVTLTSESNQKLIKLEDKSFELVKKNKNHEALSVLLSSEYNNEKNEYAKGMNQFSYALDKRKTELLDKIKQNKVITYILYFIFGMFVILTSIISIFVVNKFTKKLDNLNNELEQNVQIRTQQLHDEKELTYRASKLLTIGEVAASIAHDISNPLSVILVRADFLASKIKDPNSKTEDMLMDLDKISKTAKRISRIIKNIQFLSSTGNQDAAELINLKSLTSQAFDILEEKAVKNKVELSSQCSEDLELKGHATQLIQLLVNLIGNAIDACENSIEKKVCVEIQKINNAIQIQVIDSGSGIPPELKEKILEPLFSTKKTGKGTGLGLTISQRIIENHKAKLEIESQPGRTCFSIIIP